MSWQDDPVQYTTVNGVLTANWGTGGKLAPGTYQYVQGGGGPGYTDPNGFGWVPVGGSTSGISGSGVSTSTGVNPTETSYSLYGHTVPLSVFGVGRIGGEIIAGPWIENGLASFIISFGVPADPSGTRTLREIAFDSEVVWTSTSGFSAEAFTYRFYGGTLTQAADALETSHFGANAVAYRPQILIAFENLPIANTKFGKIPYVAAVIADAHGDDVNLGYAFETLAYSPWVGYTSDQFETVGITDGLVSGGLIIADDVEFLQLIQNFGRFYPKWSILQTDKLRIVDRGDDVTPDVVLDNTMLIGDVTLNRQEQNSAPSILELSTIDPAADYTIVPSRAQTPRAPVAVTTSVKTETAYLPAIMDSSTRIALVTYAKYHDDTARRQVHTTAMAYGLQIEPGDLVGLESIGVDFPGAETFRVLETLHGANHTVEFTAESILRCTVGALGGSRDEGGTSSWSTSDKTSGITLSNFNFTATMTTGATVQGVRATTSHTSGKWYFEVTTGSTYYTSGGMPTGICTGTADLTTIGLSSAHAFTVDPGGTILINGAAPTGSPNIGSYSTSAVICVAIDMTNLRGWFRLNGGNWNGNATYNPATNVGGVDLSGVFGSSSPAFPYQSLNAVSTFVTANFTGSFAHTIPSGFSAWG